MLSRVAENIYWTTRYLERAEDTARLINAVTLMALDMPGEVRFGWDMLIRIAGLEQEFFGLYSEADEAAVMRFLICDGDNPSSILNCIVQARENTRAFRELLPAEVWEWVNELYLYARRHLGAELTPRRRYEVLQDVIRRRQSLVGLLAGTMSRDAVFQFLRLGRNLERADMTSRILDVSCAVIPPHSETGISQYSELAWMNILKALSAYQMYRRYVSVHADGAKVIGFLFNNREFPRAISHCLQEILDVLRRLPHPEPVLLAVNRTVALIERADCGRLAEGGLHEYIDRVQLGLNGIDAALRLNYFKLAGDAGAVAHVPVADIPAAPIAQGDTQVNEAPPPMPAVQCQ